MSLAFSHTTSHMNVFTHNIQNGDFSIMKMSRNRKSKIERNGIARCQFKEFLYKYNWLSYENKA